MWRPRLLTQVRYLVASNPTPCKNCIQSATIRHISSWKDRKIPAPPKFQYQTPATNHRGKVPHITSPFGDRSWSWLPGTVVDRDCDQLRRLIHRLIDSREITVEAFRGMLCVSSSSYQRFMGQHGKWKGSQTATYARALHYFQRREELGVGISRKPPMKIPISGSKSEATLVTLDGQTLDNVPVYDTCQNIRRKINVHMRQPGVTPKAFLQHLSAQYYLTPTKIKISDLEKFRGAKGPNVENTNPVFYAAYVFFEKYRLGSKKPKSKLRERMEELYQETGGMNTKTPSDKYGSWVGDQPKGGRVSVNGYGAAYIGGSHSPSSNKVYGQHGLLSSEKYLQLCSYREQDLQTRIRRRL